VHSLESKFPHLSEKTGDLSENSFDLSETPHDLSENSFDLSETPHDLKEDFSSEAV
jgi:hypothetical protein